VQQDMALLEGNMVLPSGKHKVLLCGKGKGQNTGKLQSWFVRQTPMQPS
jgi:hypothetical protein